MDILAVFIDIMYYMKDILRRVFAAVLSLWWLWVIWYYMNTNSIIVKEYVSQYNYYIIGAIGLLLVYFFVQFVLLLISPKWGKVKWVIVGLVLVLLSFYFIKNDGVNSMYAGDILWVIGILMVYLTLAWYIVTKQAQKAVERSKQIVIEV